MKNEVIAGMLENIDEIEILVSKNRKQEREDKPIKNEAHWQELPSGQWILSKRNISEMLQKLEQRFGKIVTIPQAKIWR